MRHLLLISPLIAIVGCSNSSPSVMCRSVEECVVEDDDFGDETTTTSTSGGPTGPGSGPTGPTTAGPSTTSGPDPTDTETGGFIDWCVPGQLHEGITMDCFFELLEALYAVINPTTMEEADSICAWLEASTAVAATQHSSEQVTEPEADEAFVQMKLRGSAVWDLPDPEDAAAIDEAFPCGEGALGNTVCLSQEPFPTGPTLVVGMAMHGDIPMAHPDNTHQFGLVFDADGDTTNNYEPSPPFTNDFFAWTDLWFELTYAPAEGWDMRVSTAVNGQVTPTTSQARIVILRNAILAFIPMIHFTTECPGGRLTAFTHLGDYGLQPPYYWSGDVLPTVDQPLRVDCEL